MKISLVCLGLNLVFSYFLVHAYRQGGLGVANTLSSVLNVGLLLYALRVKLKKLEMSHLRQTFLALLGAATLSGLAAWLAWRGWERTWGHTTLLLKLGAVFLPMLLATALYFSLATWMKISAAKDLMDLVWGKMRRRG